ncbi:MAG: hypothetical protein LBJ00_04530 [Planctomycetaceae bacterium]|jgi:hypothetical protein|nr:hypothetical protein [Planctomycetaceae bacterium]
MVQLRRLCVRVGKIEKNFNQRKIMSGTNSTLVLKTFRLQLAARLFWKNTTIFLAMFLFLWGISLLVFRVSGFDDVNLFFKFLPVAAVMPVLALFFAFRRIPSDAKLISLIDKENLAGGLVMSSFEADIGNWSSEIKELKTPKVNWMPSRTIGLFLAAILFAVTSFLLPVSVVSGQLPRKLNIEDQVNKLTTQIDTLNKEKLLDNVEVQSLKRDLKMLQKEADGLGPIKTFDAIDTMTGRLNHEAAKTVQDAERNVKSLAEAESLVRKVSEVNQQLDPKNSKALMEGLVESMENMLAENQQLADALRDEMDEDESENNDTEKNDGDESDKNDSDKNDKNPDNKKDQNNEKQDQKESSADKKNQKKDSKQQKDKLKKMLADNNMRNMSPEQLQQLADAMRECSGKCERQVESLQGAGFQIDKDALQRMAESKREAKAEAERMLSELWANFDCEGDCPNGGDGQECESQVSPRFSTRQDWRTDPNAGSGKNWYQKAADEEGFDYKAEVLPQADLQAFKDSLKMGVTVEAPSKNPKRKIESNGGAITETGGGTGSAHTQQIYPVHRKPVGRFFEK